MACHLRRLKLAFWASYPHFSQRTAAVGRAINAFNRNVKSSKKPRLAVSECVSNAVCTSGLEGARRATT